MSSGIHISLSAEPILNIGSFVVTNAMLTSVIVSAGIIGFAFLANRSLHKHVDKDKPTGLANVAELIVESFLHFCQMITGDVAKAHLFLPIIASFFIFIILNNWSGLVPGVGSIMVPVAEPPTEAKVSLISTAQASTPTQVQEEILAAEHSQPAQTDPLTEITEPSSELPGAAGAEAVTHGEGGQKFTPLFRAATADLNTTLALGIFTIVLVQYYGFRYLHWGYLKKYFNFSSPILFFVGILEIVSEFAKIISFGFRLFGNIFAGEVLIAVLLYLTKVIIPLPFYGLEIFVGMMQALVFSMLSLVFYNMATQSHEEHA